MATDGKGSSDKRLHSLDALRGLAALLVLVWHYDNPKGPVISFSNFQFSPMPLHFFGGTFSWQGKETFYELWGSLSIGGLSVQLFYVLSGFIFMYVYHQRISNGEVKLSDYAVARVSRLYPLVWISTTVMIGILILNNNINSLNAWKVLTNLFLLGGFEGSSMYGIRTINGSIWTLTAEMWAYAVFFFICYYWGKKKLAFVLPVLIGMFIYQLNIQSVGLFSPNYIRVFVGFFMGCLTYMLFSSINKEKSSKILGRVSIIAFTTLTVLGVYTLNKGIGNPVIVYSILIFPALIISVLNVKLLRDFLSTSVFRWLGNLSFGIYLWHWPIFALMGTLYKKGLHIPLQSKWVMLMIFALVIVIAHLSYYYFESPVQKIIRKKYSKYKETEQTEEDVAYRIHAKTNEREIIHKL